MRKRIKEGMLIRCCESVESIDLFYGQTGTVVAVNRDIEINLQVIFSFITWTHHFSPFPASAFRDLLLNNDF